MFGPDRYSALLWAFMIGNFCAIVAGMDKHGARFRQTMDDVNYMLRDRGLPPEMRRRVRTYFVKKRHLMKRLAHRDLERTMSAQLRGEVAAANMGHWLDGVWYLRAASLDFRRELSVCLEPALYAPLEPVDAAATLYVLTRGVCLRRAVALSRGDVWGLDFLLPPRAAVKSRASCRRVTAVAVTYVEVLRLNQSALHAVLVDFPEELRRIRGASRWQTLRISLELWGYEVSKAENAREKRRTAALVPADAAAVAAPNTGDAALEGMFREIREGAELHRAIDATDDGGGGGSGGGPASGKLASQIQELEAVVSGQRDQIDRLRRAVAARLAK